MKNLIIYAASAMFALTACNALDIIPSDSYSDPVVWHKIIFTVILFSLTRSIKNIMMKDVIISGRIF